MADINYVPQVDYTSRDYSAIRQDLINLIQVFAPAWTNRDTADFGITLIELFSYMGDMLSYYIDRAANESFISTASQRDTVIQLARLLGYTPTDAIASTVTLTFQSSRDVPITLPALTRVATTTITNGTTTQVIFETDAEVTIPAKVGAVNGSATVTATQGVTVINEQVGISSGAAGQSFQLSETSVINGSISVTVGTTPYTPVQYLIDYSGYDPVFSSYTNGSGSTFITFGDGISGRIPPSSTQVYVTYRVGGGVVGNVPSNTIKNIIKVPNSTIPGGITVSNADILVSGDGAAVGGANTESTDSIRISAPRSMRAINRAVSLSDYSYLTAQVKGVAKAISTADVYTNVTVYVCPLGDSGVQNDNVTPTPTFNTVATSVQEFLVDKVPANTTVTVQPPKYVDVNVSVTATVLPQYRQSLVQTSLTSILTQLFNIDNVVFQDTITLQDVITAIASVEGVSTTNKVYKLVRDDQDVTYSISNKSLTSNVATLTTSVNHALTVGQTVLVSDVDSTFNGTYVITATPAANKFSYSLISTNVSSSAAAGSVTPLTVKDVVCAVNEIPRLKTLSLTVSGGIVG